MNAADRNRAGAIQPFKQECIDEALPEDKFLPRDEVLPEDKALPEDEALINDKVDRIEDEDGIPTINYPIQAT